MNHSPTTDGAKLDFLDTTTTVFVVAAWRTGMRSLFFKANAASSLCAWRLPRFGLLFDIFQELLRSCSFC